MPTKEEKAAFSKRLEVALRRSPEPVHGATELALRFNLRHEGDPISPQTAFNWMAGRVIPTKSNLITIAKWLNVDEHWLHYGPSPGKKLPSTKDARGGEKGNPTSEEISLAIKIHQLPPQWQYLVEDLVNKLREEIG